MQFKFSGRKALRIGDQLVRFPAAVVSHVAYSDRIVCLINPDPKVFKYDDPESSRNVWCFGADGRLLWKVEDPDICVRGDDGKIEYYDSFLALYIDDETGELRANTTGANFVIDKDTGRILRYWPKER